MRTGPLAVAALLLVGSGVAYANDKDEATQKTSMEQSTEQTQKSTEQTQKSAENVQNVDLFFATDSSDLNEGATQDLQQLADWAKCDSRNAIILEGHADPRGTKEHNLELSGRRAGTVRQKLIDMGVPSYRIVVAVFGENDMTRDTNAERRRVTAKAESTPVEPEDLRG